MRERGAYMQGRCPELADQNEYLRAKVRAAMLYPFPRVKQTREVLDPEAGHGMKWSVRDGVLGFRNSSGWRRAVFVGGGAASSCFPTPARILLWADLLTTPDEWVEDAP